MVNETTVKEKIEKWLKEAPGGIDILEFNIEPITESVHLMGKLTPHIVSRGFSGSISFRTLEYE